MAKTVARFMILAKSDRMGKTVDDKGQPIPEEQRKIRYSGLISLDQIDLSTVAKELDWVDFWSEKDIDVHPQVENFAVLEFMKTKSGEIGKRVIDIMSREEYLKSLGL